MIELPEAQTLAAQLKEQLLGKTILNVTAGASPHKFAFFNGEAEDYHPMLSGKSIDDVQSHGGHVEVFAGNARLLFGDGANLRYIPQGEKLPKKHQLLLEFDDGSHLCCTVQMYAILFAFYEGELDNQYYLIAKEKPSPLGEVFTLDHFLAMLDEVKPTMSAKAFLATEQRIPGLGNGVLQDILFHAGIHPKRKLNTLDEKDREGLYNSVRNTLMEMTVNGGRDTEKDLFGAPGGYHSKLSAKTWKEPCPKCGGELVRQAYLGGNVYFCPTCQPL